jgi:hypothetical protein
MSAIRLVVLATLPFAVAACAAPDVPTGSYAAALCGPGCQSDADCPTTDSCTIRRCERSSGACYTAGFRTQNTVCNTNHWCNTDGTCGGLREGEVCQVNADCAANNCLGGLCRGDTAQGSPCISDADCVFGDTCLGTWHCVGALTKSCRIDFSTPLPVGAQCTNFGIQGVCAADPSGETHCLFPNGTSVSIANMCQSGFNLVASDGANRCSALPDCAACTTLSLSGTACAAAADGTTCGTSDCQCGNRNTYSCSQGACQALLMACPGHFACSGANCGATCNGDTDCDSVTKCNLSTHACLLRTGQGCQLNTDCFSNFCVNGTCGCASTAECPANNNCNANSHTCLLVNGQVCTSPSQCDSGFCIPSGPPFSRCSALASCNGMKVIDLSGTKCVNPRTL